MDELLRRVIDEALAVADEAERGVDEVLARAERFVQRSSADHLVYRIQDNAKVQADEAPSEPPEILTEAMVDVIGLALALERKERTQPIIDGLKREIDELRDEMRSLRAQIEVKNVTPMRGRDAA